MRWIVPAGLCGLLFAANLVGVESGVTISEDRSLELSLHSTLGPSTYDFFETVSSFGGGAVRVADVALIVVALVIARYWWSATLMVVATGGAALLETLIKFVVRRYRPQLFLHAVATDGSSFPSGHATDTCAFALVIIYLVWHVYPHRGLMTAGALLLLAFVLLVGLSRIVLGVHYPADVVGGYTLAVAWVATLIAFFAPAVKAETRRALLLNS